MKINGEDLVFKSGKRVYVTNGIVGLTNNLNLSEGIDCGLWSWDDDDEFRNPVLTRDELLELSEHMISRWEEFRTKASRFVAR